MDKVKVLMVGNHPSVKGGITTVIEQILNYNWEDDNVEMSFVPTYIECNNIKKILYFGWAYLRILIKLLFRRPDVVHIHMSYKGSYMRKHAIYQLCKRCSVKTIVHLHGSEYEKWFQTCDEKQKAQIREFMRGCDAFVVLGERWDSIVKNIEPETYTVVVNNTVRLPQETVKWNEEQLKVLFLGVLIERKGVADLLEAVRILKQKLHVTNMQFVIAGSGKEEEKLKRLCKEYSLEDCVTFAGWIDGKRKEQLLKESHLFVLPSYNEGLPMAILEAMSYGMPIVATSVGDISTAVKSGENGWLYKPGDIEALVQGIQSLSANEEVYSRMAKKSREIIEENFSEDKLFSNLKEIYRV